MALLAVGCPLKNPPDVTEIQKEGMPTVKVPAQWAVAGAASGTAADNWLASFADAQLAAAVAEALEHNADLRAGAARVEQAQLYARLAGAKLYPSVTLLGRGGGKLSGDNSGLQGGVLSASWEVDLWGRVRYGRAAASASASSAELDYMFGRQSLAAQVAKNYFLVTEAGLQVDLARATVKDSESLISLAQDRVRVGVSNEQEVYEARAAWDTYRDLLRQIELGREQAIRALELLLGRYPAAAAATAPQLPALTGPVPGGLPSELLERRPDVVAAERRVAAAFNRVGEAKAARLPTISLTTSVSSITSDLLVLAQHDNPVWSAGASLLAPIFTGGALKRQVEIRTAEQKQAVAEYASVALRAFGEVENALSAELAAHEREQLLAQAVADNQRALEITQSQYQVGKTDLRFVSQRQLALNAARSALIRMQAEQRVQRVNVHLALGGNFATPPAPPAKSGNLPGGH